MEYYLIDVTRGEIIYSTDSFVEARRYKQEWDSSDNHLITDRQIVIYGVIEESE